MAQETSSGIKSNYPPVLQLQGSTLPNVRVTQLIEHFVVKYKQGPEFLVRVPGRLVFTPEYCKFTTPVLYIIL
jgi:hypothetical protein